MDEQATLGERLSELMYQKSISSAELAEMLDVTPQTVNRWKRGEKQMMLSNLVSTANIFSCSLDFLTGRTDNFILDFIPQKCPPFYQRLRQILSEKGFTRAKVIEETNIKSAHFYLWRKGADVIIPALIELADYFDVSLDYLVGREQ